MVGFFRGFANDPWHRIREKIMTRSEIMLSSHKALWDMVSHYEAHYLHQQVVWMLLTWGILSEMFVVQAESNWVLQNQPKSWLQWLKKEKLKVVLNYLFLLTRNIRLYL